MVMMNVVQPGAAVDADTKARLVAEYGGASAKHIERQAQQPDMNAQTLVDMFMPRNLFGAFVGNQRNMLGDVLPLIVDMVRRPRMAEADLAPVRDLCLQSIESLADDPQERVSVNLRAAHAPASAAASCGCGR